MQLKFVNIHVKNQDSALEFYTKILGFKKMADIPMGDYRWLTVSSPDGIEGIELVLEPMAFEPARIFQETLFEAGIPAAAFITKNITVEFQRLKALGVSFRREPKKTGVITTAVFEDTCGNLINQVEPSA